MSNAREVLMGILANTLYYEIWGAPKDDELADAILERFSFTPPAPVDRDLRQMVLDELHGMIDSLDDHVGIEELGDKLTELHDAVIAKAVHGQRACGRSWQYIGDALGMSRQGAYDRWGKTK